MQFAFNLAQFISTNLNSGVQMSRSGNGHGNYNLTETQLHVYRQMAALSLPRHTSYPGVPFWQTYKPEYFAEDLRADLELVSGKSLYVHVPYCQKLCHYCACTKLIVPKEHGSSSAYVESFLSGVALELSQLARSVNRRGRIALAHIHLGGGTPTYLSPPELERLFAIIEEYFEIAKDAELACEIDPRVTSLDHLRTLKRLGFNRLSLGVQDFDDKVQTAINRIQPFSLVQAFVEQCTGLGFDSINFDLIYGLPFQTLASMQETLQKVIALQPERIAFYRLALLPEIFRWQRTFARTDIPDGDLPLQLNLLAINTFMDAGYDFIGLDHFAKPEDQLARSMADGSIRRNFQGMTSGGDVSVIGIGPSAISWLGRSYAQNLADVHKWRKALEQGSAIDKGMRLSQDDVIRRQLLQDLYCHRTINKRTLEDQFEIDFDSYFHRELPAVTDLQEMGLLVPMPDTGIMQLTKPLGELLVRVVAAAFDHYLPADAYRTGVKKASKVG